MEFGFGVPTRGPMANPDSLAALARGGEEMGFEIVSVSDHVVIPRSIESRYPYNETGEFAGGPTGECLEQLTMLSFLAGVTSSARLLTSVMVLPHRSPVLAAKMIATADVLSGGRVILGCGVGWMREEFEVIGAPPYDERGAVGDEYIRVFKELWTSDDPSYEGDYAAFSDVSFQPKPVQKPHPPIWIGGESPPALRRAGSLGDAWYPIGSNPRFRVGTVEQLTGYMSRVRNYARDAGRDPAEVDFAYSAGWYNDREAQTGPDGSRQVFTGAPEQIAGDVRAFEELGVRHLMVGLQADSVEESLAHMDRFADKVRPLV